MRASVIVLLALAGHAYGDTSADARAEYDEGVRLYEAGDYLAAVARFERAFELEADPVYLFNIGQAYRLANDCTKALDAYRRYLERAPDAPNRAAVEGHQQDLAGCAAKPAPVAPLPVPASPEPRAEEAPPGGRPMRIAGLVAIGVGAAATLAGGYFAYRVRQDEADREELFLPPANQYDEDKARAIDDRGARHQRWMIASFATGGAMIAGGVVLYLVGRSAERTSSLTFVPTEGGMALSWGTQL